MSSCEASRKSITIEFIATITVYRGVGLTIYDWQSALAPGITGQGRFKSNNICGCRYRYHFCRKISKNAGIFAGFQLWQSPGGEPGNVGNEAGWLGARSRGGLLESAPPHL